MDGGEFLERLHLPELRHRPLPSSERLVRNFDRIVKLSTTFLFDRFAQLIGPCLRVHGRNLTQASKSKHYRKPARVQSFNNLSKRLSPRLNPGARLKDRPIADASVEDYIVPGAATH